MPAGFLRSQLAGGFVLLQKNRLRPAERVFQLAESNLRPYPSRHHAIDLAPVLALLATWREKLRGEQFTDNPLATGAPPLLAWPDDANPTP